VAPLGDDDDDLLLLLKELGRRIPDPTRVYLFGGGAMLLLGSPRATLDLDYIGDDLSKDDWQLSLERLASDLKIDLEAVPLDRFIPLPDGTSQRHIFFRRFDNLEVFIFDPYAIAISKIERGFDSDIDDVVFLIKVGYVDLEQLGEMLARALEYARSLTFIHTKHANTWTWCVPGSPSLDTIDTSMRDLLNDR